MNVHPHFLSTTALVGRNGNAIIEGSRRSRATHATNANTQTVELGSSTTKLHRTSGRERKHRDRGFVQGTRVVPRNESGEIPD